MKENFEVNRKGAEVNRRGPEFAGAFEWVKGKHGYSALRWARLAPFFAAIGAAMIMYTAGEEMANRDEIVVPTASPRPPIGQTVTPSGSPATASPTVSPTASPSPSPTASPTPSPSPSPTTTPAPPPNLPAAPQQADPKVTPTPEPETSPTPEPEVTPTPTPTYEAPSFVATEIDYDNEEHSLYVPYTITLNDAAAQEGKLYLLKKDPGASDYAEIGEEDTVRDYNGDRTETWSIDDGEDEYFGLWTNLELPSDMSGGIVWLEMRFDYTLTDGTTGSVFSEPFYVCVGNYLFYETASASSDGVYAEFIADTGAISDMSKLAASELTVAGGSVSIDVLDIAEIDISDDGVISIAIPPDDFKEKAGELSPDADYDMYLTTTYTEGDASWDDYANGPIEMDNSLFVPSFTVDSATYWQKLNHAELEYTLTQNGATLGDGSFTVKTADDVGFLSTASLTAGSDRLNGEVTDSMEPAGTWTVEGELNYSSGGIDDTMTIDEEVEPTVRNDDKLVAGTASATRVSDMPSGRNVDVTFTFDYSGDTRHDYDVYVSEIDIGWMGENYATAGDIREIWVKSDDDDTGGVVATKDESARTVTFSYSDLIEDVTPPENAGSPPNFYLSFALRGTGTDTELGDVYYMQGQTLYITQAMPLYASAEPTVSIDHVYAWNELNVPGGLRLAEVGYNFTPGGAEDATAAVTITYAEDASYTYTWDSVEVSSGSNTQRLPLTDADLLYPSSGWNTEVKFSYTLDGIAATKTVSANTTTEYTCRLDVSASLVDSVDFTQDITGTAKLDIDSGDPVTYAGTLTDARLGWVTPDEPSPTGSPVSVLFYDGDATVEQIDIAKGEEVQYVVRNVSAPSNATGFWLWISGTATGDGYEYVGGLQGRAVGTHTPSTAVNPFQYGDFTYSPGPENAYLGGSVELQSGVTSDQLTDLSFTIYKNGAVTNEFSTAGHVIQSAAGETDAWVGFQFSASSGDTVPSLDTSASYQVEVSAVYAGTSFTSSRFSIDMPSFISPSLSVTVNGSQGTLMGDNLLAASGQAVLKFDPSKTYTGELQSFTIYWYDTGGNLLSAPDSSTQFENGNPAGVSLSSSLTDSSSGQLAYDFSFSGVPVPEGASNFVLSVGGALREDGTLVTDSDFRADSGLAEIN